MSFDERDVNGLQAKLQGLDLTVGEHAALEELVVRVADASAEIGGFVAQLPRVIGDLDGFLSSDQTTGSNVVSWLSKDEPLSRQDMFLSSGHTTGSNVTAKPRIG